MKTFSAACSSERLLATPAAGTRSRETGALQNVGTNGEFFSSSAYAAGNPYATILNYNSGGVNPLNTGARGLARSVRCVQHLPAASSYDRKDEKGAEKPFRFRICRTRPGPVPGESEKQKNGLPGQKMRQLSDNKQKTCHMQSCAKKSDPGEKDQIYYKKA